jgi:hypothetical protein
MCKICLFSLLLFLILLKSNGQTVNEWINQKSTQKQYLVQQIAALQEYIGYVSKGYQIARKGLNTIGDIKKGHMDIDKIYFSSLELINPKIVHTQKASRTSQVYESIKKNYKSSIKRLNECKEYSTAEMIYLKKVLDENISECSDLMATRQVLLSSGELKMSDDERMQKISGIYDEMLDRYAFQKSFSNDIVMISNLRKKEQTEVSSVERFYK